MVYQTPPGDTNEELLGISNKDFPKIFYSRKSEPSKSACDGGSDKVKT